MATYCDADDVKKILQLQQSFSGSTTPTSTEVVELIEEAEDEIDNLTQHSWRSVTVTDEYYNLPKKYNWREYRDGLRIKLRHRKIKDLASVSGDKLEVWNGTQWEDWLTSKTEGRDEDYWLDNEAGVLYLRLLSPYYWQKGLRMTYRYGESTVPKDIRRATALNAAIKVLQSDDRSGNVAETGDPTRLPYDNRVTKWQKEIDRIVMNRGEVMAI